MLVGWLIPFIGNLSDKSNFIDLEHLRGEIYTVNGVHTLNAIEWRRMERYGPVYCAMLMYVGDGKQLRSGNWR